MSFSTATNNLNSFKLSMGWILECSISGKRQLYDLMSDMYNATDSEIVGDIYCRD